MFIAGKGKWGAWAEKKRHGAYLVEVGRGGELERYAEGGGGEVRNKD